MHTGRYSYVRVTLRLSRRFVSFHLKTFLLGAGKWKWLDRAFAQHDFPDLAGSQRLRQHVRRSDRLATPAARDHPGRAAIGHLHR